MQMIIKMMSIYETSQTRYKVREVHQRQDLKESDIYRQWGKCPQRKTINYNKKDTDQTRDLKVSKKKKTGNKL